MVNKTERHSLKTETLVMKTITKKELEILSSVYDYQNTDSCGNFKVETNEEKGVIGSLVKKELVYDSYEGDTFGKNWQFSKYSFCCTKKGIEVLNINGFNTSHLQVYYDLYQ